jgi:hypothetical protein
MSLVHEKHPGIKEREAMWSLGMDGGAARRNWAIPAGDLDGGGVEKEDGPTMDRFVASEGWGNAGSSRPAASRGPGRGAPGSGGCSGLGGGHGGDGRFTGMLRRL